MKTLELYVCEVCGTQYSEKVKCAQCEKGHKRNLSIVGARYLPHTQDKTGMPVTIEVSAGGEVFRYKR